MLFVDSRFPWATKVVTLVQEPSRGGSLESKQCFMPRQELYIPRLRRLFRVSVVSECVAMECRFGNPRNKRRTAHNPYTAFYVLQLLGNQRGKAV